MWISFFILLPSLEYVGDYFFANSQYSEALTVYKMAYKETRSTQLRLKIGAGLYVTGDKENSIYWFSNIQNMVGQSTIVPSPQTLLNKIYFDNGIIEINKNNLASALMWFEKAQSKYGMGFANYKLGNTEKAKELFSELDDEHSLGVIDYYEGHFEEAVEYFSKTGNDREIGACLYRMGKYDEALEYFKKVGDDLFSAECYYRLNKWTEAEYHYEKMKDESGEIKDESRNRDAIYGLAWTYYKLEDFGAAESKFNDFIAQYSDDYLRPISMYYGARSALKAKHLDSAIRGFNKFITEYARHNFIPNAYYWVGKAYFATSNYDSCIKNMKILVSGYPQDELVQYGFSMLGNAYREMGEYDSAIYWYSQVDSPAWAQDEARFKIEGCYFSLGKYDLKIDISHNFVRKYPESPRAPKLAYEIGNHWEKEKEFHKAIDVYEKVIQEFSFSPYANRAKMGLADCYLKTRQIETAFETYRELLNTGMRKEVLTRMADAYFELGKYEKAMKEYALLIDEFSESEEIQSQEVQPQSVSLAQYQIGMCYESLDKPSEARIAFQGFIEKYPESNMLWEAWIRIAKTYLNEGLISEYERTLIEIVKSEKLKVKSEELRVQATNEATFMLASLYFDKGDYEEAHAYYLDASSQYEDVDSKSIALIGAAKCAVEMGNDKEAREFYEKVIALVPNPKLEETVKESLKSLESKSLKE
ncbi:MAG: tetratricopeptide repeat protein [Candidatus Stahlbacteria bacterium]|nr:tetratricopeptide repeat protein [Candidatus Stahlbacteria bacterium]